jgi:uncharacterized OsmC-like protein
MKAVIQSAARVGSRVRLGDHDLVFDQPSAVAGGEDRGPSPLDVLVASIGACAHYFGAAYLHARGLSTADLRLRRSRRPLRESGALRSGSACPPG